MLHPYKIYLNSSKCYRITVPITQDLSTLSSKISFEIFARKK